MTIKNIVVATLIALPAHAETVTIRHDTGGRIADYIERIYDALDNGTRVEIRGLCLSACTLYLHLATYGDMCVADDAVLGFHSGYGPGWTPDVNVFASRFYPPAIAAWYLDKGQTAGPNEFYTMTGAVVRYAAPIVKRCD